MRRHILSSCRGGSDRARKSTDDAPLRYASMRTVLGRLFWGRVHDGFRPGIGAAIFSPVSLKGAGAMQPPQSPRVPGVGRRRCPFSLVLAPHRVRLPLRCRQSNALWAHLFDSQATSSAA